VKILRETPVLLTVFQMIDLWKTGCRCGARAVGVAESSVEIEQQAQALVTGILVAPMCILHDSDNANADGLWSGGEIAGVVANAIDTPGGEVQILLPDFGEPAAPAEDPTAPEPSADSPLSWLARRAHQIIPKGFRS
jgi:hypothetical protein